MGVYNWRSEVHRIVRERLPSGGEVLLLSLTGSRAFGWGSDFYDIDVRGFYALEGWFDTCHLGFLMFDINLEELGHVFMSLKRRYWTIFEDTANPFYIHPDFDYEGFRKLCSADNVRHHLFSIRMEVAKFKLNPHLRSALHAYRLVLCPLYFLKTGVIQTDVRKCNEEVFGSSILPELCRAYATRQLGIELDVRRIQEELDTLLHMLEEELGRRPKGEVSDEEIDRWIDSMKDMFWGDE